MAFLSTSFTYNGITMTPVKTIGIEETPVYTDDGLDYLYTRVVIRILLLYNPQYTAYTATTVPVVSQGTMPAITEKSIRHFLMQPRQQLIFSNFNTPIVNSPDSPYAVDANNGPRPISCNVTRIDGTKTFHVMYAIETWLIECPISLFGGSVLSNRWGQSVSYDENHLSRLTSTGRTYFRTDLLSISPTSIADGFRDALLPVCPPGFQRERITFNIPSTGNMIDWQCDDQEKYFDLGETDARRGGSGVTKIEANYGVQTQGIGDVATLSSYSQVNVQVWGNKYAHNWTLLQYAVTVAAQRLPVTAGDPGADLGWLKSASFSESLTARYISLNLTYFTGATSDPAKAGLGVLPLAAIRKGDPFAFQNGLNPSFPNDNGTRGTAQFGLLSAALKDACSSVPDMICPPETFGEGVLAEQCGPIPAIQVNFLDFLPSTPNYYVPTPDKPYTRWKLDRYIRRKEGSLHMPLANPPKTQTDPVTGGLITVPQKTSSVMNIHSPIAQTIINFEAERFNDFPQIPDTNIGDENMVLIDWNIVPGAPELSIDGGTVIFSVRGTYTYAMKNDPGPNPNIPLDSLPWIDIPPGTFSVDQTAYIDTILNSLPDDSGSGSPPSTGGVTG